MRLGDPDVFREIENERSIHMEYDQLGDWISKISKIRPLCRIYACPSVLKGIRRHLLLENAYLPLSVLTDEQEKQLRQIQTITKDGNDSDRAAGTADPQNLLFLSDKGMQTEGPAVSFLDPETFDRLSRKEKKRLLDLPLELDELRLTARLLLAGVSFWKCRIRCSSKEVCFVWPIVCSCRIQNENGLKKFVTRKSHRSSFPNR
ncbi:hypothetical protein [Allobaculum sp. Allo2]|uniref:hypothetical protein n=1 Tax=Allobaculum sp. Allo2 TaxID=2853432 RepID=UPI001F604A68|nr:hypothetical protein [Allobaculum sp. Allo2]UNT92167.1 hypothetical protein KWG61_07960 [Allobaculum sp. Allo2]